MSALSASGARKKQRARPEDEESGVASKSLSEKDLHELRAYLQREEMALRADAKQTLNHELIDLIEQCKELAERVVAQDSFSAALESDVVRQVRKQLSACYRLGVRLESWLNTYLPPLSAGGNVGVSAEVQDGIFQNVHAMTIGSCDALHRMLAFEKEHVQMRTKCTDDAVSCPKKTLQRIAPAAPVPASPPVAILDPRASASLLFFRYGSVIKRCVPVLLRRPSLTSTPTCAVLGKRFTAALPLWLAFTLAAGFHRCDPG
jgi:hypothetical protein